MPTFISKRLLVVMSALSLSPVLGCTSVSPIVHRSRVAISLSAFWYVANHIVHLESTTYDFLFQLLMYDHEVYQIFYTACRTQYTRSETEIYLLTL